MNYRVDVIETRSTGKVIYSEQAFCGTDRHEIRTTIHGAIQRAMEYSGLFAATIADEYARKQRVEMEFSFRVSLFD